MDFQNAAPSGPPRLGAVHSLHSLANNKFESLLFRGWNVLEQFFKEQTPQLTENQLPVTSLQTPSATEAMQQAADQVTAKTAVYMAK